MSISFGAAAAAYFILPHLQGSAGLIVLAGVIGFAFGTMWSVSAPLAGECFGMTHFAAVFGLLYTAYGFVAGGLGPWLTGYLLDVTNGDYVLVFTYLGLLLSASAGLIWLVRPSR